MRQPRGYVLPLTLVLIALCGAALAQICRQNMRGALATAEDCRKLQHKWGMLSCQAIALANASALISQSSGPTAAAPPMLDLDLSFGGQRFRLRISDEQAKVNLNMLDHARGRQATEQFVLGSARVGNGLGRVFLRPMHFYGEREGDARILTLRYGSFGQVFADSGSTDSIPALMQATANITCWGDGKLNYRRASIAELTALAGDDPKALKTILARKLQPAAAALALNPLNFQNRDGKALDDLFTENSNCFSVWLIAEDGSETEARFAVAELGMDGRGHLTCFSW